MEGEMITQTESRPIAFAYRERRADVSDAMFLQALIGAIGPALKMVAPVIGQLAPAIGGLFGGGAPGAAPRTATGGPSTQEIIQLIQQVLQQVQAAQGAASSGAATGRVAQATALADGRAQSAARAAGINSEYSSAAVAPLLAALPALMPFLQQVLTPETVQSIIGMVNPKNVLGAVTDGITQVGRLAGDIHLKELEHFRQIHPSLNDPGLDQLLASLSHSAATPAPSDAEPRYTRTTAAKLDFAEVAPQMLEGRTRVCCRAGRELQFPLSLETDRPIRNARLFFEVKEAGTRTVVLRTRLPVPQAGAGRLSATPRLSSADAAKLRPGTEYLLTAHLVWPARAGEKVGTSITQLVTMVGEYTYGRTAEAGPVVPLNDIEQDRDYWHKIWQGTFTREMRSVEFDCKYYFALEPERDRNARMETIVRADREGSWKERGRMQSGMALSPAALNALLPRLGDHKSLGTDELAALRTPEFVQRFNQAARFKAAFRGVDGTSAALWIFPELRVAEIVLHRATKVDDAGQVQSFAEHTVRFPVPALIHYIGARTTR
jgi:hypothetical protein